jgi:hypothetical protein
MKAITKTPNREEKQTSISRKKPKEKKRNGAK